jgi:ribonuclease I
MNLRLPYSYYILAVQNWCSGSVYYIHGLWADYNSTSYPTYCTTEPFNKQLLEQSSIYKDIQLYWNGCSNNTSSDLHQHEWEKHGTCISEQTGMTQLEFFEKTIELYKQYRPLTTDLLLDLNFL